MYMYPTFRQQIQFINKLYFIYTTKKDYTPTFKNKSQPWNPLNVKINFRRFYAR